MDAKIVKPVVTLQSEEDLRVFMLPLRQKILRMMQIQDKPVTSKHVADLMGISPSSARHHLKRLQHIGLVEHDHFEQVNGIKADYLRPAEVTVSIGGDLRDGLSSVRYAATVSMVGDITRNYLDWVAGAQKEPIEKPDHFQGDVVSGVIHVDQASAEAFYRMVRTFVETHTQAQSATDHAWEYAFFFHDTTTGNPPLPQ
ncbi:MAG: ArsR/SmtB family transcription factor [Sphaerochaetaceae bacterium]